MEQFWTGFTTTTLELVQDNWSFIFLIFGLILCMFIIGAIARSLIKGIRLLGK